MTVLLKYRSQIFILLDLLSGILPVILPCLLSVFEEIILNYGTNNIPTRPRPLPLTWAVQWAWASSFLACPSLWAPFLLSAASLAPGPNNNRGVTEHWPSLANKQRACVLTKVQDKNLRIWPIIHPSSPSPPAHPLALQIASSLYSPNVWIRVCSGLLQSPPRAYNKAPDTPIWLQPTY